jgi:flavin reductase (DIM6/NTAB) family NADH-FMN oxidoreductase RutF
MSRKKIITINPNDQTKKENYKLLTGTIIPRPIAFVTSSNQKGVINGAPFSFFNVVSSDPPMISLAIQRKNRTRKDTARNIMEQKEFVVHSVDEEHIQHINMPAASLPADQSEIEKAGLILVESEAVSIPGIKESKVRMECTLEHNIVLGEEDTATDFIIGRVRMYHVDGEIYQDGKIDFYALNAMSRLAGPNYAKLGKQLSIKRPE